MKEQIGFAVVLAVAVGAGCSSAAKPMPALSLTQFAAVDSGRNELVFMQSRLVIPDGWWFERRDPNEASENNGVKTVQVFRFGDGVNNISGAFYYTTMPNLVGAIEPQSLMKVYTKKVIRNVRQKEAHPTTIDGESSYVITGVTKEEGWDYMGALVPEENAFNLIMLLSDPGTLGNHPEVGFRIFGSYAYEKEGTSRRGGTGLIQFNCPNNYWAWYDDWKAGPIRGYFVIDNPDRDTPIGSIGVARVDVASLEALRPQFVEFKETVVGPEFDVTLPVGKAMVTGRGLVTRSETRLISAYYFLPVAGNNHLVMVDHDEGATDRDPATLHEWPVFTEALTRYFSF